MNTPASPEEIQIPKTSGSERTAVAHVAAFALSVGFDRNRTEEIKTAVGEAVVNAIEHASPKEPDNTVAVRYWMHKSSLKVTVSSKGQPFTPAGAKPDMRAKIEGRDRPRGWGMYLMTQLSDNLEFGSDSESTFVTLTFRLRHAHHTTHNA